MSTPDAPAVSSSKRFLINVLWKTALLLVAFNLAFAIFNPLPVLAHLSLYNRVFPGRARLPFGENPEKAYNFSLYQVDAMFAAHEVAASKVIGERRVLLIGDSSVWGYLLPADQTLAAQLNKLLAEQAGFEDARVYNLGYPTITLTKDLLLLDYALQYQPDLIVWLTTLEAFPRSKQLESSLLQNNPESVRTLIRDCRLASDPNDPSFIDLTYWERTLFGRRRPLADLLRLQLYGLPWAATGIDQYFPEAYERPQSDLEADLAFHDLAPERLQESDLAWDVLQAGLQRAGSVPVLLVNEPIFISQGANSDLRYNYFYPRWAYDQYREQFAQHSAQSDWRYLDAWNIVPAERFTNSAIHMDAQGDALLAQAVLPRLLELLTDK